MSNYELFRIFAMFLVLMVHSDFFFLGFEFSVASVTANPSATFLQLEVESLTIIAVDCFVLLSGFFGIRTRFRSVSNIMFQVFFWQLTMTTYGYLIHGITFLTALKNIFSLTGNWFVECYLMLMFVAPFLNNYTEKITEKQLLKFIITFYTFQTFYGYILRDWPFLDRYSLVSFIGLYLLGRYINLYGGDKLVKVKSFSHGFLKYFIISTIVTLCIWGLFMLGREGMGYWLLRRSYMYLSPFVVYSAVCLLKAFGKLQIKPSQLINKIAASAFAVYLIHMQSYGILKSLCQWNFHTFGPYLYWLIDILTMACIFIICILMDQLRIWAWKRIWPHLEKLWPHTTTHPDNSEIKPHT
ncbi:MAG: acyltransferase family protein [Muribaculaceae bacterium]|nr:acyltransferase family protein [Muribaculaceae bacterium]